MKYRPDITKFQIDNHEIVFVNQFRDTTSGFAHDTTIFYDGCSFAEATCHYLNRTWERYQYQSVMMKAVNNALDHYTEDFKRYYMENRGWKKMTAARRETFEAYLENKEIIVLLNKLKEKVWG